MIPFILMGSLVTELESPRVTSNVVYPSLEEVLAKRKRASEEGHSSSGRGSRRNSGCGRELVDNSVQTTQRFLAEEASAGPREEEDEVKPPDETEAGKEEENFTEAPKPPTGNSSPGTGSQTALLDKATENVGEGAEQPPTKQEQDTSEDKETTEDKEMTEDKETTEDKEKAKEEEEETEDKDEETFSQEQRRMKRSRTHSRQVPVCQVQIHALKDLPDIFKEF